MSLSSWSVAVPKAHIHYARDHYWKYLIHMLCFSASKAKGFIEVKWNWNRAQASSQQKEKKSNIKALHGCKPVNAPSCSCQPPPVAVAKEPLNYSLWVGFLKPELYDASDTQECFLLLLMQWAGCGLGELLPWELQLGSQRAAPGDFWNGTTGTRGPWALPQTPPLWAAWEEEKGVGFMLGIFQHLSNFQCSIKRENK